VFISPASFWVPERLPNSAWLQHGPFAFWLIGALRPRRVVELGTHNGYSYSAFCQAVKALGLPTECFAIDTWAGDQHAGRYSDEIYDEFKAYHDARYGGFSRLVRKRFDEAVVDFEDGSIDLLHVDGRHFYEDAKEDFELWESKLSDRAVVLFHDTCVRQRGFGVWRLWAELTAKYPALEFHHGFGLGVLGYGRRLNGPLSRFFALAKDHASVIRESYLRLGGAIEERCRLVALGGATVQPPAPVQAIKPIHIHLAAMAPIFMDVRTTLPLNELAKLPNVTTTVSEKKIHLPNLSPGAPKVAVVQRFHINDTRAWIDIVRSLTARGWLVVGEIDDHPDLMASVFREKATESSWDTVRLVHAVQTSTEKLATEMRAYNPEVAVFPNAAFSIVPLEQRPAAGGPIRIFFAALNRERYSSELGKTLAPFAAANRDVEFVVVHDKAFFDGLGAAANKSFCGLLAYQQYLDLMGTCDVALMPLEGTGGETFKSDLKFVEASSQGLVTVASPIVYGDTIRDGETGIIARTSQDWVDALMRLRADIEYRHGLAFAAQQYVVNNRLFSSQADQRIAWYSRLWDMRDLLTERLSQRMKARLGGRQGA
jgi:hypothetical protein